MSYLRKLSRSPHVLGDPPTRTLLASAVVVLLFLASGGFVLGLAVGLSPGWIVLALGIAIAGGALGAGLVPTVGLLWLVGLWWFVFPPLVGYLTGDWAGTTRYNHPRVLGFAYESPRAELVGGIEYGLELGLSLAVVLGLVGYAIGLVIDRLSARMNHLG